MNQSPLLGRPGAMWASLCVSSVCMHLSSVPVSLPPLRALSLGPGPAGLCLRVPLTLVPLPLVLSINYIHCGNQFRNSVPVRTLSL